MPLTSPNKPANIKSQPELEKQNLLASRPLKSGCKLVNITLCKWSAYHLLRTNLTYPRPTWCKSSSLSSKVTVTSAGAAPRICSAIALYEMKANPGSINSYNCHTKTFIYPSASHCTLHYHRHLLLMWELRHLSEALCSSTHHCCAVESFPCHLYSLPVHIPHSTLTSMAHAVK